VLSVAAAVTEGVAPFADRFWTSADELNLHARDYPAASGMARAPVICIHGLTRNARDFEDLAPHLAAQGRRVLAVDVRGRGASAWDPDPGHYMPAIYAADILTLMDALAIARAVFIGTSMGGLITMGLGALRPSAIAATVLNDVGPELGAQGLARIAGYVGGAAAIDTWDAAAAYAQRINESAFPGFGDADWMAFARHLFTEKNGGLQLDYDPNIAKAFKPSSETPAPTPDLWPLFEGLAAHPLLTIRGATSDILTPAIAEHMRLAAPDMDYVEIPGVGHAPLLNEPEALRAIDDLLKRAP
jgi:pimeloyl-ACP methyl ester carboxylesterase